MLSFSPEFASNDLITTAKCCLTTNSKHKLNKACASLKTLTSLAFAFEDNACSNEQALKNFWNNFIDHHVQAEKNYDQSLLNCDYASNQSHQNSDIDLLESFECDDFYAQDEYLNDLLGNEASLYLASVGSDYVLDSLGDIDEQNIDCESSFYCINQDDDNKLNNKQKNIFIDLFIKASLDVLDNMRLKANNSSDTKSPKFGELFADENNIKDINNRNLQAILNNNLAECDFSQCDQILLEAISSAVWDIINCSEDLVPNIHVKTCESLAKNMQFNLANNVRLINIYENTCKLNEHYKANFISNQRQRIALGKIYKSSRKIHKLLLSIKNCFTSQTLHTTNIVFDCCQLFFDRHFHKILSPAIGIMLLQQVNGDGYEKLEKIKNKLLTHRMLRFPKNECYNSF